MGLGPTPCGALVLQLSWWPYLALTTAFHRLLPSCPYLHSDFSSRHLLCLAKSLIPRPPCIFGWITAGHSTRWNLWPVSFPEEGSSQFVKLLKDFARHWKKRHNVSRNTVKDTVDQGHSSPSERYWICQAASLFSTTYLLRLVFSSQRQS